MITSAQIQPVVSVARRRLRNLRSLAVKPLLCGALTFATLIYVAFSARRGFDPTDEGFYLLCADHPEDAVAVFSFFGPYVGLLKRLVGHDLIRLRLVGLLLHTLSSAVLAVGIVKLSQVLRDRKLGRDDCVAYFFAVLQAAMFCYAYVITTPNYNSLTSQAISVIFGVLFLFCASESESRSPSTNFFVFFVIGALSTLCGLVKITSGILALLLAVSFWLAWRPRSRHWLATIAGVSAGIAAWWTIHGWISGETLADMLRKFELGREAVAIRGKGTDQLLGMPGRYIAELSWLIGKAHLALIPTGVVIAAIWFRRRQSKASQTSWPEYRWILWGAGLLTIHAVVSVLDLRGSIGRNITRALIIHFSWLIVVGWVLGWMILFRANAFRDTRIRDRIRPAWRTVLFLLTLLMLPIVFAFGTSNRLQFQLALYLAPIIAAVGFLVLALLDGLRQKVGDRVGASTENTMFQWCALAMAVSLVCQTVVLSELEPKKQNGSLSNQSVATVLGPHRDGIHSHTALLLDPATSRFYSALRLASRDAGFVPGMDVMDFTGKSPGIVWALGASAPAAPWLFGGFPGSQAHAEYLLKRVDTIRRQNAWLLIGDHGRMALDHVTLLDSLGLRFPDDYRQIAAATFPLDGTTVSLWRPVGATFAAKPSGLY